MSCGINNEKKELSVTNSSVIYGDTVIFQSRVQNTPQVYSMIGYYDIEDEDNFNIFIKNESFKEKFHICKDEPIDNSPTIGSCVGYAISKNIMAIPAHCLTKTYYSCNDIHFFKHTIVTESKEYIKIPKTQLVQCTKILYSKYDEAKGIDLILMETNIKEEQQVKVKTQNSHKYSKDIYSFTSQGGRPLTKIKGVSINNSSSKNSFKVRMNFFKGSSGSPLFSKNHDFLGILIKGEKDFIYDKENKCRRIKKCNRFDCTGETILKSEFIFSILNNL